jgi:hypothetical protein
MHWVVLAMGLAFIHASVGQHRSAPDVGRAKATLSELQYLAKNSNTGSNAVLLALCPRDLDTMELRDLSNTGQRELFQQSLFWVSTAEPDRYGMGRIVTTLPAALADRPAMQELARTIHSSVPDRNMLLSCECVQARTLVGMILGGHAVEFIGDDDFDVAVESRSPVDRRSQSELLAILCWYRKWSIASDSGRITVDTRQGKRWMRMWGWSERQGRNGVTCEWACSGLEAGAAATSHCVVWREFGSGPSQGGVETNQAGIMARRLWLYEVQVIRSP